MGREGFSLYLPTNPGGGIGIGGEPDTSTNKNDRLLQEDEADFRELGGAKLPSLSQILNEQNIHIGLSLSISPGKSFLDIFFSLLILLDIL